MSRNVCRFLQPHLCRGFKPSITPEQARVYISIQRRFASDTKAPSHPRTSSPKHDYEKRVKQLQENGDLRDYHPRLVSKDGVRRMTPAAFCREFSSVTAEAAREDVTAEIFGRVRSVRYAGSKLIFLDLERQDGVIQALCNFRLLDENGVAAEDFRRFKRVVGRGDWISVVGHPYRSQTGELTIRATTLPQVMSPALHNIPRQVEDREMLARQPHVDGIVHQRARDVVRLKHHIKRTIHTFLVEDGFIEVETPMLDVAGGGAVARAFETRATELSDTPLKLRIAPELWLKRLIVSGQEKIFEVGRAFRNEGVDNTHNPEFTICEFYEVGATLEDLMQKTEALFRRLASTVRDLQATTLTSLSPIEEDFSAPFARLPFIPTIERAISRPLPELGSPTVTATLQALFAELSLPLPSNPTLPRLLDSLAETYIEPLCDRPTFITHHPEILSPLSKSYVDPTTGQIVAARAELFIRGREYVNAYEEENSPFVQRAKFEAQLRQQEGLEDVEAVVGSDSDGATSDVQESQSIPLAPEKRQQREHRGIDESYLEALEWGMPPTGGWGCGMDRLVMLFSGSHRIADALPFGTLRNVVAIAGNRSGSGRLPSKHSA